MRVVRGRSFPTSDNGLRHAQEVRHMNRKVGEYTRTIAQLTGAPGAANTLHLYRHRLIGARNRLHQLEQARIGFIRQGVYQYPDATDQQAYLWA